MNIGKAAPPQTLPISASIPLSALPADLTALTAWCETLDVYGLLKNAVGISTDRLYLTAHLGSEEIRNQLVKYGFDIDRRQVCAYVLSKNHDTTSITAKSLTEELVAMSHAIVPALRHYQSNTQTAVLPGVLDNSLAGHLMRLIVPEHTLSLAVVFPLTPTLTRLSFDTLILGAYARGQHTHQLRLSDYLQGEMELLNQTVAAIFPDLSPAFKIWATSYVQYLLDRIAQPGVAEDIVAQVTAAIKSSSQSTTETADVASAAAGPTETLKEKMERVRADAGIEKEEGPLTGVGYTTTASVENHGIVLVRRRVPSVVQAWQIPHPLAVKDGMITIPHWALLLPDWTLNNDHDDWLVYNGMDVEQFTDNEFAELYDFE